MSNDTPTQSSDRLDQIIAEYLAAEESGAAPPPDEVVAANLEMADELRKFFANRDQLAAALPGEPPTRQFVPPTVRYFGDYELLDEIARGGMGVVYRAKQTSLNRVVAIKMILSGNLAGEEDVKRFQTEAEAAGNLKHPGIVPVHEVGMHEGQHYFSMDYIEGRSLAEIVRENPLAARKAAEYVQSIAEAVDYAHQQGTLHRDLKPANVLVDAKDHVHITDFGLAVRVEGDSDLTRTGQILGTPAYMPPEQAQGKRGLIGPASDVYSQGVILYELLTGRPPFKGESSIETLQQVIESEPVAPRLLNPKVPRDLETICLKCLQKEPHKRYATAAELADDVRRFLKGEPIAARPIGLVARTWRWCRRKPIVAGLLATVVVCLIAGTAVSTYFAIEADNRAWEAHLAQQETEIKRQEADANASLAERLREESEASERLARQHLYVAHMNLVQRAWEENRMDRVRDLLDRQRPELDEDDFRGFEWYYWNRLCAIDTVLRGHTSIVTSVVFSPDGTRIASAAADQPIKLWDAETGAEIRTLNGHATSIYCVAFSPDGTQIASAGADQTIKLWNAETGAEIRTLSGHGDTVRSVAFSPDGIWIASASFDQTVKLWDTVTGAEIRTFTGHANSIYGVAFSPDGTRIASAAADQTIKLWNAETGAEIRTLTGHTSAVHGVVFSPDGMSIASAGGDQTIKLWDTMTGAEIRTLTGHTGAVYGVAFSPDGMRIASAGRDRTIKLWDTVTGAEIRTLNGHPRVITNITFSPDGTRIASAGADRTIKLWNAKTEVEVQTFNGHASNVRSVAFNRDGTLIVTGSRDRTVKLWDVQTGAELRTFNGHGHSVDRVEFSPDGTRIASAGADQTVKLWNVETGAEIRTLNGHATLVHSVAFSPDGTRIALAGADRTIKLWDAVTGERLRTLKGQIYVSCVAFSSDGMRIGSASQDGTVKLWDAETGADLRTLTGHTSSVHGLAFSPDGTRIASASQDGTVKLWDAETGAELRTLNGHISPVYCVAFSPDGMRIASGSDDRSIKLWDAETGEVVTTLQGHTDRVVDVAFNPDGTRIASASKDWTVRLWETTRSEGASEGHRYWRTLDIGQRIADYQKKVEQDPTALRTAYELAAMLRYSDEAAGYRVVVQRMFDEHSKPGAVLSTHTLLMAHVFFPEGGVTPDLLEIAQTHARGENLLHRRMLGLALYRLERDDEALPLLESVVQGQQAPSDSRLVSLLSLALVQLRLDQRDAALITIREACSVHGRPLDSAGSSDRQPWGVIPSLWREVQAAMDDAEANEPIPELPPTYAEWARSTEPQIPADPRTDGE